ncbi:MAG: diguanylate cyclase [Lachnospiraceae bacterium]|nr:diguanylate cyclase [Lachnospiraceae bacterium]
MKINPRERFLIALLVISVVVGLAGCLLIHRIEHTQSAGYMEMLCREKGKSLDDVMESLSGRLMVVASGIESAIEAADDPYSESFIDRTTDSTGKLLEQILDGHNGHAFAYLRFNERLNHSDKGWFLEKTQSGVENVPLTVIKNFRPDDMEHVGWYYVPMNYGAPMWMDPYNNANVGTYMFTYAIPIYHNNEVFCLLGVDIDLNEMLENVRDMKVYDDGFAILKDKSGKELNEAPILDYGNYATAAYELRNGMTLNVYVSPREVYPLHYSLGYKLMIASFLFVGLVLLIFILYINRSGTGEWYGSDVRYVYARVALRVLAVLILAIQLGFLLMERGVFNKDQYYILQERTYGVKLKAVAAEDFEPYSYVNDTGSATGHDIELVNALANAMDVNIEVELMDYDDAKEAVENGAADMIVGLDMVTERQDRNILQTRQVADDAIVIYGRKPFSGISELRQSHYAMVSDEIFPDMYSLRDGAEMYGSVKDALRSVVAGTNDYAIVRRSVGVLEIGRNGYEGINQVYELMENPMCIGVRGDKKELFDKLEAVIARLEEDETIKLLQEKWLSDHVKDNSILGVIKRNLTFYVITGLVIFLCLVIMGILWMGEKNYSLRTLSEEDALTGIYNRGAGERAVRALIEQKPGGMFILFDADKFKSVNDSFGHSVGDMVLKAIAECMRGAFGENDVIMRFGGDEFAAFLPEVRSQQAGAECIEKLFELINTHEISELEGRRITISVGAVINEGASGFEELYSAADAGAYESKKKPGNTYTFKELVRDEQS